MNAGTIMALFGSIAGLSTLGVAFGCLWYYRREVHGGHKAPDVYDLVLWGLLVLLVVGIVICSIGGLLCSILLMKGAIPR